MQPGSRYAKNWYSQQRMQHAAVWRRQEEAQRRHLAGLAREAQARLRELERLRRDLERLARTPAPSAGPQGIPGEARFRIQQAGARVEFVNGMERLRRKMDLLVHHSSPLNTLSEAQHALTGQVSAGLEAVMLLVVLVDKASQFVCPQQRGPLDAIRSGIARVGEALRRIGR